jgi:23S rRNA (cytidine1920-2'-O)/16S rRNA (cytidine1409-2'-O)-methyltransferase
MEERLDKILVQRGLISNRSRAEQIIVQDGVLVNGKLINKTGKKFPEDVEIQLLTQELAWVSKGALKLLAAIEAWNLELDKRTAIDLGASTGGFTEVLLSKGVEKIYCVDVGHGQLHPSIQENPKIVNLEKTHARDLTAHLIPELVDLVVIDVSFISLEKVIPFVQPFLKSAGKLIALVKPQFEVGKGNLNKNGLVKDTSVYPQVLQNVIETFNRNQLKHLGTIDSPILGGDGNREFLCYFCKN